MNKKTTKRQKPHKNIRVKVCQGCNTGKLGRELFFLWEYICSEGLAEEARDYLEENADNWIPFDLG